jgi:hypothetical protein
VSAHVIEWDPPFFFLREWQGLSIYGHRVDSPYEEDKDEMRRAAANGWIMTESFSVACVEGELGSQPMNDLIPISKEEFEDARARGWEPLPGRFGMARSPLPSMRLRLRLPPEDA